jgi:hypothetical protein
MKNNLLLAIVSAIAVLSSGCGGGNDPTLSAGIESKQAVTLAVPQNGVWWNPTQSGRGYSLEVQGNQLVFTMYLYDDSGSATWNTGILNQQADGSYTGTLSRFSGGQSLNGTYVAPTGASTVGTVSLSFTTTSTGTAILTPSAGGSPINLPLQKFSFSTATGITPIFQSGVWWSASESGRGYYVEAQGDQVSIGSYMYDTAGQPVWYTTLVTLQPDGATATGPLLQFANGQTLTGAYKTPGLANTVTGNIKFTASSSTSATLTLPNATTVALTRFQFNSGSTTPTPTPAAKGKVVYAASCALCHGANPSTNIDKVLKGANSASTILSAIRTNKGGMGILSSTIGATEAADLAAYLATPNI